MLLVLSFVFFMLLGLPLFGVIGLASIISMIGMPFPMEFIPQNLYTGMDQFPLIATIGFVMAGFLMEPAGITGEIIEVAKKAVGNIRGGLAMVTILACMIFAALSGSGPATPRPAPRPTPPASASPSACAPPAPPRPAPTTTPPGPGRRRTACAATGGSSRRSGRCCAPPRTATCGSCFR